MRTNAGKIGCAMMLAAGVMLGGCQTIHVQGVGDVCNQNVRVDVVGVSWVERPQWEALSMQEYWSEGNQRRKDSIDQGYNLPIRFGPGNPCEVTLKKKDRVWKKWKERGATHFLVMFDTCRDDQSWRLCLPLSGKCWGGLTAKKAIEVLIQPSGVSPKTPPKPGCGQ